mgnify:CR=1 FL=1
MLYCILFLHQTTTEPASIQWASELYCILFLHQTTTHGTASSDAHGCIASSFYIKPQLYAELPQYASVVLHPLSTSNHNRYPVVAAVKTLYCILFLHQTTTILPDQITWSCCIASSFYIKPQLRCGRIVCHRVVLHPLSTSNHNQKTGTGNFVDVVLHPLSTSNHNFSAKGSRGR